MKEFSELKDLTEKSKDEFIDKLKSNYEDMLKTFDEMKK
jgi:hypothetical protein